MTKRICVIYTGGTLGMQKTPQGYQPVANYLEAELRQLPLISAAEMPDFTVIEYAPLLDSSDMQPQDWQRIATDIHQHFDAYDGFVVLHGTDTMAYTAAALCYLLPNISKPVVLTGAQIPLCERTSDAPLNVRNALYVAANSGIAGVSLLFDKVLLRGDYATKSAAQALAGFSSPNAEPLLTWTEDVISGLTQTVSNHTVPQLGQVQNKKIAVITLFPGLDVDLTCAQIAQPWDAIVLQTFGSGNAPQNSQLLQAFKQAHQRGVLLVNRSQCSSGRVDMGGYAGGHALSECGFISAEDKTLEATVANIYCHAQPVF